MGKRTTFERSFRDFYRTPFKALLPLIPYLRRDNVKTFAEVCCGDGDLIRHLQFFGLRCVHYGDIRFGQDALEIECYSGNPDAGITNPPFKYPEDPKGSTRLLIDLIEHFFDLGAPFYLLLPHDWSANKNSAKFLRRCTDIIVIGRVKWIQDSKHNGGFENSSWYKFDVEHCGGPVLRNDRSSPVLQLSATEMSP
jgi:hypothetical protein